MYTVDELKQIIEHAQKCGVARMSLSEKSIGMDFYNKPQAEVVRLIPNEKPKSAPEIPMDLTHGTGFTEDELFLSAGGV